MKTVYRKYLRNVGFAWAGCCVLYAAAYLLVIRPELQLREQLQQKLRDSQKAYELAVQASSEQLRRRQQQQLEQLQQRLKQFVLDFEDSANLTFEIGRVANKYGIRSFSIQSDEGPAGSTDEQTGCVLENRLNISLTANFGQFAAFLNALERHQPVLFVESFDVTRPDSEDLQARANIRVVVMVKKPTARS